jgi:hypothetical protein
MKTIADVKKALRDIGKHQERRQVHVLDDIRGTFRARIYTKRNYYTFLAHPGYLGCVVSSRTPWAGEEHRRGADLHDGKLNRETWNTILGDIVAYEMVGLAKGTNHL